MPVGAMIGISAVAGLASSSKSASATKKAAQKSADTSLKAAKLSVDEQRRQYDQSREDLAPYRDAGYNALGALNYEMGLGDQPEGFAGIGASPALGFQIEQGQNALDAAASARGLRLSGATLQAAQENAQGLASQDYWRSYNALAGIAGVGQTATNTTAALGASTAAGVGNALQNGAAQAGSAYMARGQGAANGYLGANNALQGTLSNIAMLKYMEGS